MRFLITVILFFVFATIVVAREPDDLIRKINTTIVDTQLLSAYKQLVDYYQPINTDSAIYYAEKGLKVFSEKKYPDGEAWMLDNLGEIDDAHGRTELALERYQFALKLFRSTQNIKGINEVGMSIGILDAQKGNYIEATRYFISALKYFDSIGNKGGLLRVFTNLGIINERNKNKQLSIYYFNKAEEISKNFPVCEETINLYNNIGGYYLDIGDTAMAAKYILEGISKSDKPEFTSAHLSCLINMGILCSQTGKIKNSISYLQQALKIAKVNGFPDDEANVLANLMSVTMAGNPDLCLKYAEDALILCKKLENKPLLADIYDILAEVYKSRSDYKSACDAREKRQVLLDSLYNSNRSIEIQNIGAMYELNRSNIKVKQMQLLTKEVFRKLYLIIALAVIFIIALGVVFFYFRKTARLNRQLMKKESELRESNAMKDKLFSIIGHDLRAPMGRIPSIVEICTYPETSEEDKLFLMQSLLEHSKASLETLDKLLYWGQLLIKGVMIKQEVFQPNIFINANIALKIKHAEEKKIKILNQVSDAIKVFADPNHFDFIIRNLLMNAIKFSNEFNDIIINGDDKMKPGFVVFSVKDSGVGIDKALFEKIFEPHYTQYGTANEKGNGIGLMLCKEFVLKNGGQIWLESELGKGTTFYFSLKKQPV